MKKILLLISAICLTLSMKGQSLSGVYTIDNTQPTAGRNFNTFEDAIDALNTQGISAAVTFDITAGQTFNIVLTDNKGLQITTGGIVDNPVVFRKSGNAANPLLKVTGTNATDVCFYLDGVNYLTFDGLDIENAGTSINDYFEQAFYLANASNFRLLNCNIRLRRASSNYCINTYGTVNAIHMENVVMKDVWYGVYSYGTINNFHAENNTVRNADLGYLVTSGTGNTIIKNDIDSVGSGIQVNGTSNNLTIAQTKITHANSYGIITDNGNNQRIYNNQIHATSTSSTSVGIYIRSTSTTDTIYIAHNTVYNPVNTNTGYCLMISSANCKIGLYNNIFINKSTNSSSRCILNSSSSNNILPGSNNNIYFNRFGSIYANSTVTVYTVADYVALLGDGRESASQQVDVPFISTVAPFDFNVRTDVPTKAESGGQSIDWVTTDIDGNPRHGADGYEDTGSAPDIGAYEFEGIVDNNDLSSLSGVYTIDNTQSTAARNFNTFEDAINALNTRGVSDTTTFDITTGQTHTIALTDSRGLRFVVGGTVDKPVIFQKSGSGANPSLRVTGTSGNSDACFYLDGVNYITFDGLDFENVGTASSDYLEQGFYLVNASNIQLLNCNIRLRNAGSNYGIRATGTVNTLLAENISVINASYGYYMDASGTGNTIRKNAIDSIERGIYCRGGTLNNLTISETKITNATSYGIYLDYGNNQRLYNNLVQTTSTGIYKERSNATDTTYLAHNTVFIPVTSNTTYCLLVYTANGKLGLYNNIFIDKSTNNSSRLFSNNGSDNSKILPGSNNNIYFSQYGGVYTNSTVTVHSVTDYADLLGDGRESASQQVDVPFISTVAPFDFNVRTDVPTKAESGGQSIDWVTTDIDGNPRQGADDYNDSGSAPDIGAYEFDGIYDSEDLSALSGIYTIDNTQPTAARNFNTFEDAIVALNTRGVSDTTTFDITAGQTHTIALTDSRGLRIVVGGTVDKPVIFQKSGSGANPSVLVTGTSNSGDACFNLDGVNYVTFDGLDIENVGTSNSDYLEQGFYLVNVSNIQLLNCNIRLRRAGNNFGIRITGTVNTLFTDNISVINASYGYYSDASGTGNTIRKNAIDSIERGIYCRGGTLNNFTISENKITNATSYGIYLDYGNNQRLFNNLIQTTSTGIYMERCNATDTLYLAHNTVYASTTSNTTYCLMIYTTNGKLGLYNNIFIDKSTNNSSRLFSINSSDNSKILPGSNNNIYFSEYGAVYTNSTFTAHSVTDYANLLGDGRESASQQTDVPFISTIAPFDFNVRTDVPTKAESGGQSIDWVTTDIDGNPRQGADGYNDSGSAPDIGAYEFDGISDSEDLSALSGVYTIDNTQPTAARNFNTFEDAINALNNRGVSDTTTFDITTGQTHTIALTDYRGLRIVVGGTVDKPVIFQKSGSGANPLVLVSGTSNIGDACFNLDGVNYITFDGLDIENIGTTNSDYLEQGFYLVNVSNIQLLNCNIRLRRAGNNFGIRITGTVNTLLTDNISVINASYGYYSDASGTGNTICKNKIDSIERGIYCRGGTLNNFTISENKITNATSEGIYLDYGNNQRLYNNLIQTTSTGIYVERANATDTLYLAYNTVYVSTTSNTTYCLRIYTTNGKLGLYNNIFIDKSTNNSSRLFSINSSDNSKILPGSNNNIYFSEFGAVYTNSTVTVHSLTDYIDLLGDGRESASQQTDVPFISTIAPFDFNVRTDVPTKAESGGQSIDWVTTDIDGNPRHGADGYNDSGSAPDIGAYEFDGISDSEDLSALSGVYTIDNTQPTVARNFNTFEDAINALNNRGISDTTTFDITTGQTHTIALTDYRGLRIVVGGTVDKPVIFQKSGSGANPSIHVTGTSNSGDACFHLDGVNYITFNGLDIENVGTSNSDYLEQGFYLVNVSNIQLFNCNIRLRRAGNNFGIRATGTVNTLLADNISIINASNGYYMDASGTGNTIRKNAIDSIERGIYCRNGTLNNLTISENKITNATSDGIYVDYGNNQRLYNNLIQTTSTGIYKERANATDTTYLAHNTVYVSTTSNTTYCLRTTTANGKLGLYNNIFIDKSTNNGSRCFANSSSDNNNILPGSNNNIYFCENGTIYSNSTVNLSSVTDYIDLLGDGRESASQQTDVPFISTVAPFDFNIRTDVPTKAESGGQSIDWVTTDIDGNPRHGTAGYNDLGSAPDIGAYEFDGISDTSPVPDSEYNALKAFYQSTDGDNWTRKWVITVNDLNQRSWEGVGLYAGHVVSVQLPSNNLSGSIPDLVDLPYLQTLNVSGNSITGIDVPLPVTITNLQINNQSVEGGDFVVNGKTTEMQVPGISKYNHSNQSFDFVPTFDIYQSSTKINSSPLNSVNAASFFNNMNEDRIILSGSVIELRQTNGNATGTSISYTIDYRMGDSNIDSLVNVLDIQQTLNYVLMEHPSPFNFGAANMYDDTVVNIQDLVLLVSHIQSNPLESGASFGLKSAQIYGLNEASMFGSDRSNDYPFRTRSAPEYAELQVDDGIVYLATPVEVAAFDIRISGASVEDINSLMDNPDMLLSIRKEDDSGQISVLAFSLGGQVIPSGRTALFTLSKDQTIEQAIMSTKSAQPIEVLISNSPTNNDFPTGGKIEIFNAPNPFSDATTFMYYLSEPATAVRIKIYNSTGQLVELISNLPAEQGRHKANYQNTRLPAGIYIYVLETVRDNKYSERQTNKMLINK